MHRFRRCVQRYRGNRKIKSFSCLDQFRCMAFAQLTYRESLRDIEACLRAQLPLAGGIVLQMDQAAPAHQEVLRHLSERCEIANLGGGIGIRSCGHHQKAARSGCLALHIVTGVFSHFVRENAVKQRLFRNQLHF